MMLMATGMTCIWSGGEVQTQNETCGEVIGIVVGREDDDDS